MSAPLSIPLPVADRWAVENSPARRVPSHGTDRFGLRHAIDLVGVDEQHRSAPAAPRRPLVGAEAPERFVAFGRPVLSPVTGTVVAVHDGEPDHQARRSPLGLLSYMLGQGGRLRQGLTAVAGNHVLLRETSTGLVVTLVHLRRGSVRVAPGDRLRGGEQIGACGNSGNSTQPHVHVQVTDTADLVTARGVPVLFRDYREWPASGRGPFDVEAGVPAEGSVVEAR